MAAVVFYMEDDSTLVHRLEKESTSIGRHPESDVVLSCVSSSTRHALIKQSGNDLYVQDLGSSNGTRVNGAEVEEAKLKDGDRIGFGDVQAVFYAGEEQRRQAEASKKQLAANSPFSVGLSPEARVRTPPIV